MSLGYDISLWGEGHLSVPIDWWSILRRLNLRLPPNFPLPRGSAKVRVALRSALEAAGARFQLHFAMTGDPDIGLRFGGLEVGGPIRLWLACDFDTEEEASTALDNWHSGGSLDVRGTLTVEFPFRLPAPPNWDIFRIRTGDQEGWLALRLELEFERGTQPAQVRVTATLQNLFKAEVRMPGAGGDATWLEAEINSMSGSLIIEGDAVSGALELNGSFSAHLRQAWMMTPHTAALAPLFSLLESSVPEHAEIRGTLSGALTFNGDSARLNFKCALMNAEAKVNLHDLLAFVRGTVRGNVSPPPNHPPSDTQDDLGLSLHAFSFELSEEPEAAFELEGQFGGFTLRMFVALSYKKTGGLELVFGLGRREMASATQGDDILHIPLRAPRIRKSELEPLKNKYGNKLTGGGRLRYNRLVDAYFQAIEAASDLLSAGEPSLLAYKSGEEWRIEPQPNAPVISSDLPVVFASGRTADTQELVVGYNSGRGWRPLLIKPAVEFERVAVHLPLQNLRDVRVSGTIRFTCEGPFRDVSKLPVTLGLSVDMIYASVDTDGGVGIDVPSLLPGHDAGRMVIGQCRLGFGYSKRSFAFSFAGELFLPRSLIDDLDTSDVAGAGIRFPERSNIAMRFDLIPFVLGKAVIPLPSFQANWDLRRSASAANIQNRETCEPGWDGLQIVVPNLFRVGLERISFSPLLAGVVSYWNSDFAGDVQIGDMQNGFTFCLDNSMWAYAGDPSIWTLPLIPILSIPFFDDACVALRVGGFSLGFDLQRPLPKFSPFALFELLALVSDPLEYEIAPRGELADTIRATLANGRISLPALVCQLFPGAGSIPSPRREITVNLADYIRLLQMVGKTLAPILARVLELARNGQLSAQSLRDVTARLSKVNLAATALSLAESVPPALRQFAFATDLAGFRGTAHVAFTTRQELLQARQSKRKTPKASEKMSPDMAWNADKMELFQPLFLGNLQAVPIVTSHQAWFGNGPFASIGVEDLREIPAPEPSPIYTSADVSDAFIEQMGQDDSTLMLVLRGWLDKASGRERGGIVLNPVKPTAIAVAELLNRAIADDGLLASIRFKSLPDWLLRRTKALTKSEALKRDERRVIHRMLLEYAFPSLAAVDSGLICLATLGAFGVEFRMLGWVRENGDFLLITHGEAVAPRLSIAGVPLPLPCKIVGRATLNGKVTSAGVVGSIRLMGYATDVPLIPNALTLSLGSKKQPVAAELWSTGRFNISGHGSIALFNGIASLSGSLALTDERIAAEGALTLFGLTAAQASFRLDHGVAVIAALLESPSTMMGASIDCHVQGMLGKPDFLLEGTAIARFKQLAFELEGSCRLEGRVDSSTTLTVEGAATWQGLGSLRGDARMMSDGVKVRVSGHAAYRLQDILNRLKEPTDQISHILGLTPFSDLLFQIEIEACFVIKARGGVSVHVRGSWLLGLVRRNQPNHAHAVLTGRFDENLGLEPKMLVGLQGLQTVPLPSLPLPPLQMGSTGKIELVKHTQRIAGKDSVSWHINWDGHHIPPYPANGSNSVVATVPGEIRLLPDQNLPLPPLNIPLEIGLHWKKNEIGVLLKSSAFGPGERFFPLGPSS
jgi:hypothetical protein